MKEPRLSNLRVDDSETRKLRKLASAEKTVKITVNIDAESLSALRREAAESGVPYQRLLNKVLREALTGRESAETRIARLEREVTKMKKKLVA
jgi:predicted DNA binding CopG/RHH family protein